MKTSTAMIATTLLLATASTTAFAFDHTNHEMIVTGVAQTKADAYKIGVDKLSSLNNKSAYELSLELAPGNVDSDTVSIDNGFITVQERANPNGQIGYVGLVNVDVNFSYDHEDDNN